MISKAEAEAQLAALLVGSKVSAEYPNQAGMEAAEPSENMHPSTQLASLAPALRTLREKWLVEAAELDIDGDICCAETRRNDAEQLARALLALVPEEGA